MFVSIFKIYFLPKTIKDTLGRPKGSDMSPDLMQFLNYITLAQAQECILEKSMMDNRKAIIIGI
jgi:hypothetical protein